LVASFNLPVAAANAPEGGPIPGVPDDEAAEEAAASGRLSASDISVSELQLSQALGSADLVTISGSGWGHGIGLSQYGSLSRDRDQGQTYAEILAAYYTGSVLEQDASSENIWVNLEAELVKTVLEVRSVGGGNTPVTVSRDDSGFEPAPMERWWGSDRYATAAEISQQAFPGGADTVLIGTGMNFPDALAAAPLARAEGAPILLVRTDSIPSATAAELRRLGPDRIYVLGGWAAVSNSVVAKLQATAPVTRVWGTDRYETAAEISKAAFPSPVDTVFVATGEAFPDALAGASVAADAGGPMILTRSSTLVTAAKRELARLQPQTIVALGGGTSLSAGVVAELGRYAPSVVSVGGADRYSTAVAISTHGFPSGAGVAFIATGAVFADALAVGPAAAAMGGPVLLVPEDGVPRSVSNELERLAPDSVIIVGGTGAVSAAIEAELGGLLGMSGSDVVLATGDKLTVEYVDLGGPTTDLEGNPVNPRRCRFSTDGYDSGLGSCVIDLEWDGFSGGPGAGIVIDKRWFHDTPSEGTECQFTFASPDADCTYVYGELHIRPDDHDEAPPGDIGFHIVAEIGTDDYARGISEMPASWPSDALRAQTVAARTYARYVDHYRKEPSARQWCWCDIYDRSIDQVYVGWLDPAVYPWANNWSNAATATAGEVLTYSGKYIGAFYSSSNGGASENNEDIWGGKPLAYLRSVPDPWSLTSSNRYASWEKVVDLAEFAAEVGLEVVESVEILSTYDSGSPSDIAISGTNGGNPETMHFNAVEFKALFGLRSAHVSDIVITLAE
jgi:SpoIID/LytB domain protein